MSPVMPATDWRCAKRPKWLHNGGNRVEVAAAAARLGRVTVTIACALDIPFLAEAAIARGLQLVPVGPAALSRARAALFGVERGDPAARIDSVRAAGWRGPLMLVLGEGCAPAIARALDAGADDAVALPSSAGEIAARLAARLRDRPAPILIDGLRIDPLERHVSRDGQPLALLPREYALLIHLARQPGRCVAKAELLAAVWGLRFDPGTNVVEVHVSRLRAKLDRGFATPLLRTDKGQGYRLGG